LYFAIHAGPNLQGIYQSAEAALSKFRILYPDKPDPTGTSPEWKAEVEFWPNPSRGSWSLSLPEQIAWQKIENIELFSVQGSAVPVNLTFSEQGNHRVEAKAAKPGLYFLLLQVGGEIATFRLMIE
jgi:hypothetical protein